MIRIVADSTVQLSQKEKEEYDITLVPLNIIIDGKNYQDGIDMTKESFISMMQTSKALPTTSQPSVGLYADIYNEVSRNGDEILSIHVAGSLSGTYSAAVQGAAVSKGKVTVFDSHFVDRPLAYQVIAAAKMAKRGYTIPEILKHLEKMKHASNFYIVVLHLDNLIKGGRISHTMGKVSMLLNIKLLLKWSESGLDVDTKGRGLNKISKKLEQVIQEMKQAGPLAEIGISHAGLSSYSLEWIDRLKQQFPGVPIYIEKASPALLVHAGKEAFGISYLPKALTIQ